jgi:hypothetical protein
MKACCGLVALALAGVAGWGCGCGNGNPSIPARELQMEPLHHGGDSIVKTTQNSKDAQKPGPSPSGTLDLGERKDKK